MKLPARRTRLILVGMLSVVGVFACVAAVGLLRPVVIADEHEWVRLIGHEGAGAAAKIFDNRVQAFSSGNQHAAAHAFGGALYAALGTSGLSYCSDDYSYGCTHEFLGRLIADKGLDVVAASDLCSTENVTAQLSCEHGVGHGIVGYLGYDETALMHALSLCDEMGIGGAVGGCYGGVFMEYNMRTMLPAETQRTSEHADTVSYDPCPQVSDGARRACYFWLPQWWHAVVYQGHADVFAVMASACRQIPDRSDRMSCFEGVGNRAGWMMNFNITKALEVCDALADSSEERFSCRSAFAKEAVMSGEDFHAVLCRGLEDSELGSCLAWPEPVRNR